MILNEVAKLTYNNSIPFENNSILYPLQDVLDTKIHIINNTEISKEIQILNENIYSDQVDANVELIILSEPESNLLTEEEFNLFMQQYESAVKNGIKLNKKIIHIVSNKKWFTLFESIIKQNKIPLYLKNDDYSFLKENIVNCEKHIIEDYLYLKNFHHYSNTLNNNLLIDLTSFDNNDSYYTKTINSVLEITKNFEHTTLLLSPGSFIPKIANENISIRYSNNAVRLENYTYVFVFSNTPYTGQCVDKIIYYSANSKVVFTNYNFKINNMIPSVILNLSEHLELVKPLSKADAIDIINENRNTILYNYTSINLLDSIYKTIFNKQFMLPLKLKETLDYYEDNRYLIKSESSDFNTQLKDYKYDLEITLAFPILFLGYSKVSYLDSFIEKDNEQKKELIIIKEDNKSIKSVSKKKLSVVVPIHNNGKYLKYKCFRSLKMLSRYDDMEIIFIDDGSTDSETVRIVNDILLNNKEIVYKHYETGSGSASRPRNVGIHLATTDLITYLDPDNETIDDGHSILLNEMLNDETLDMVVGDIVREDNNKRNAIRYSNKIKKAMKTDVIENTKETLIKTNLTVQSIQGLIVKKAVITGNNILMVEGAAGQDTLYFQELLLFCDKVKVMDCMVHSYYAYVEGSVTNTVSSRFFSKFYKVELERIKFLIREELIEYYMNIKFNFYFKNWYIKKYSQVTEYEKEESLEYLEKILDLYKDYHELIDDEIFMFIRKERSF